MAAFFGAIGKEPPDSQVSSQTSVVPRSSKERKSGKHSGKLLGEQFSRGGEAFNLCHDEDLLIWSSSGSVCLFFFYLHTVQSVPVYLFQVCSDTGRNLLHIACLAEEPKVSSLSPASYIQNMFVDKIKSLCSFFLGIGKCFPILFFFFKMTILFFHPPPSLWFSPINTIVIVLAI